MKNRRCALFLAAIIALPALLSAADPSLQVVKITVTRQPYDNFSPWQKSGFEKNEISGCILPGNRILTKAYALTDHVMIEVSRHGDTKKYPARVIVKDYYCGLAILDVADKNFYRGLNSVTLFEGGRIIGKKAAVYRWDAFQSFKEYTAEVNKSSVRFYDMNSAVYMHQLSTGMNDGGSGEPVFVDGKLAGIVTGFDNNAKTLFVISVETISRMIRDLSNGTYEGMPFFWIENFPLESDVNLRSWLGIADADTGVLLGRISPLSSGYGVLQTGDVILSVNGIPLDDNGMADYKNYGKINYIGVMHMNHVVGDRITMKVLRDRQKIGVSFALRGIPEDKLLIQPFSYDRPPMYVIFAGFIFQELTKGYLETWGGEWEKKANKRFMYYHDTMMSLSVPGGKKTVFISRVLPAPVNSGYQTMNYSVLKSVNGVEIVDLRQLKKILDETKEIFVKFDFVDNTSLIIEKAAAIEQGPLILKKYNIVEPFNLNKYQ